MLLFEVGGDDFVEVMVLDGTGEQYLQGVAQQGDRLGVVHEHRVGLEDVALLRIHDVGLESNKAVLAGLLEHLVEYL